MLRAKILFLAPLKPDAGSVISATHPTSSTLPIEGDIASAVHAVVVVAAAAV
jgi:hypothetical protein